MATRLLALFLLLFFAAGMFPGAARAQCGGTERWAVKVGADSGASTVDLANPATKGIHELIAISRPPIPSDEDTRVAAERNVYVVDGRLVKFKLESGQKGDQDYHLVLSDDTLQFSQGKTVVPHSIIAEVVNPDCIPGKHGTVTTPSHFEQQITAVREKFKQQFPNITGGWNDAEGIPVRITAVAFFDRDHGQTGRAGNGLELHPVLDIVFEPGTAGTPTTPPASGLLQNPGFENGPQGWVTGAGIISNDTNEPARTGSFKAWLGGYGEPHKDQMYQQVTLPAGADTLTLAFYVHVSTEEQQPQVFDTLTVAVRRPNGSLIKKLTTLSNQNAAPGYKLKTFDLTPYKGQTVRIYFNSAEDAGSFTSFVIDDVRILVEQ